MAELQTPEAELLVKMSRENGDHAPSIEGDEYKRSSPSQVKTFDLCAMKWWLDKKKHLPRKKPSKGQLLGTQCHKQIEHWALTGQDVRGPIARHGHEMLAPWVHLLPFNGGPVLIEAPLEPNLTTPGGVQFIGYADMIVPPIETENGWTWPVVIDHKFRKDLEAYAETEEELAGEVNGADTDGGDAQAVIYPAWALTRWPQADGVVFRHHNHQTQGRKLNDPVEIRLTRARVLNKWNALQAKVDGPMKKVAALNEINQVPYNDKSCGAFGGCDFALQCPHSPIAQYAQSYITVVPTEKGSVMGLLDQAQAMAGVTPSAPAASASPAVQSTPVAVPAAVPAASQPSANAMNLPEVTVRDCVVQGAYMIPQHGNLLGAFKGTHSGVGLFETGTGIKMVPDDAKVFSMQPPAPASRVLQITPDPAYEAKIVKAKSLGITVAQLEELEKMTGANKPATQAAATQPILSPTAPASQPANIMVTVTTPATQAAATEAPAAEGEKGKPGRKPGTKNSPGGKGDLIVLVDCATNTPTNDLNVYGAELAKKIADAAGISEIRLASNESDDKQKHLTFGKWRAVLSLAVLNSPPSGLCSINSGEINDVVIEALAQLGTIVRGR